MFSALRHYPPTNYRLRPHKMAENLGFDRRNYNAPAHANGTNRFKYFRRPIIPYMPTLGGQIMYARKPAPTQTEIIERPPTPPTRTIAIQTLYRFVS